MPNQGYYTANDDVELTHAIQSAIVEVLVEKTIAAAQLYKVNAISVAGGVSANSGLRSAMQAACDRHGLDLEAWTAPVIGQRVNPLELSVH